MKRVMLVSVLLGGFYLAGSVCAEVFKVRATMETEPVPHSGDRADDATIWVHPAEPNRSVIIGTDKDDSEGGLAVYDLAGRQMSFVVGGKMNNIDVRYNFRLGGSEVDIISAGNRTDQSIAVYAIDPDTRQLRDVAARAIIIGIEEAYGFCLYHSWETDKYYAFVNDKEGQVEQWELFDNGAGKVDGRRVRWFDVGKQTEGMAADDELGYLYVGEEDVGIWKYGAEATDPTDEANRILVDSTEGRWTTDEVSSPCIDAGDAMSPIGYEPFPNGGVVNIGAYGGAAEASKSYFGNLPVPLIGPAARIIDGRLVVAGGAPGGFDPLSAVWAQTLNQ